MPDVGTIDVGTDGGIAESDALLQEAVEIVDITLRAQAPIDVDVAMTEEDA